MWNKLTSLIYGSEESTSRENVFFDITINDEPAGRIVMELFDDVVPRTARNFRALCTGEKRSLHYKGNRFHRIIPEFMCQAGDITKGDGTGGMSIYGAKFADESFAVKHSDAGILSMANAGKNTNNSQFFITTVLAPCLDGAHVAFGKVVDGMDIVMRMDSYGCNQGLPRATIVIADCGIVSNTPNS